MVTLGGQVRVMGVGGWGGGSITMSCVVSDGGGSVALVEVVLMVLLVVFFLSREVATARCGYGCVDE